MKKKLMLVLLSAAAALILTACAQTASVAKQIEAIGSVIGPVPTVTAAPEATPKPTYIPKVTPTPSPTAKPFYLFPVPTLPPKVTPAPTVTPSPTPRPTVTPYVPPTVPPVVKTSTPAPVNTPAPTDAPVQKYQVPPPSGEEEEQEEYHGEEPQQEEEPYYEEPYYAEEEESSEPEVSYAYGPTGQEVADYACQFVGYNYLYGGASPSTGFDCSGLVYYVYSQFGYTLNRVASSQANDGISVSSSELQPGDVLCFYTSGSYIGHAGIYIGGGQYVHAESSSTGVVISDLSSRSGGYECRRIIY